MNTKLNDTIGCIWNKTLLPPIFTQIEDDSNPVMNWSWTFKTKFWIVEDSIGWPHYRWMPDGHISTLWVRKIDYIIVFSLMNCCFGNRIMKHNNGTHFIPTMKAFEVDAPNHHYQRMQKKWILSPL